MLLSPMLPEPDYEQLMQRLPEKCFTLENVYNQKDVDLFYIDGAFIFPPNVKEIGDAREYKRDLFYVYGAGVEKVGICAFKANRRLIKAILPNAKKIDAAAFYGCHAFETIIAPKCEDLGDNVFYCDTNLKNVVMRPKILEERAFGCSGVSYLNLPSVVQTPGFLAFSFSQIRELNLENCGYFGDEAFECNKQKCLLVSKAKKTFPKECTKVKTLVFTKVKQNQLLQIKKLIDLTSVNFKKIKQEVKTMKLE